MFEGVRICGGGGSSDLNSGPWYPPVDSLDVPGKAVGGDAVISAAVGDVPGGAVVASLGHGLITLHHEPVPALQRVRLVLARAHAWMVKIICKHRKTNNQMAAVVHL